MYTVIVSQSTRVGIMVTVRKERIGLRRVKKQA